MKNGKGIKVIIVLVVVIALVVIGGLKIKNVYDGFMDEYKGTESASGNRCNDRDSGKEHRQRRWQRSCMTPD